MGFKAWVDSSWSVLFCTRRSPVPTVYWDRASNLDHSPVKRARYHCTSPARPPVWHLQCTTILYKHGAPLFTNIMYIIRKRYIKRFTTFRWTTKEIKATNIKPAHHFANNVKHNIYTSLHSRERFSLIARFLKRKIWWIHVFLIALFRLSNYPAIF